MAGRIGKEVGESQFCFHSWAWIPARRLVREKQEAPHEIDKSTQLLFASFLSLSLSLSLSLFLSISLSLSLSLSPSKHALPFFSSPSPPFPPRPPSSRSMSNSGLAALQQRSHLGSRSVGDACRLSWVRQCCTYKQKPEWGKKKKLKLLKKKKKVRQEKETAHSRGSLASLALWRRDRESPWWSWELCDFDVTSSCDVISPDHFVRGFYNSSFRRCRPNFLVLQKEYKILVHNLSICEKLEQSTHWIIQKKWGKDFTFGSDCTVEFFQVLNLKEKKKVTKTPERSELEPKTIRSRILGLSTWAICELTIAGGKKSIKPFRTRQHGLPVLALQRSLHRDTALSSRNFRVEGQVSGEWVTSSLPGIRLLFPSASEIPAWLFPSPYWPRLRLGQYLGSENNSRYFLGLEK